MCIMQPKDLCYSCYVMPFVATAMPRHASFIATRLSSSSTSPPPPPPLPLPQKDNNDGEEADDDEQEALELRKAAFMATFHAKKPCQNCLLPIILECDSLSQAGQKIFHASFYVFVHTLYSSSCSISSQPFSAQTLQPHYRYPLY